MVCGCIILGQKLDLDSWFYHQRGQDEVRLHLDNIAVLISNIICVDNISTDQQKLRHLLC